MNSQTTHRAEINTYSKQLLVVNNTVEIIERLWTKSYIKQNRLILLIM